ncbi:23S rRNA (pseudouridine(1915)-N(3))-methyltransferase RlmH [Hallella multisaccharivorax]|uniref:23S rRNA (pseudouridine(1915)-N(3))-methyltransferase RlmH n=1 Tax=Hallella multisaccharivorax TaxID=310514 RepID=UPI0036221E18
MKTTLILIGKTDGKLYQSAINDYAARIAHYMPFAIKVIPDIKNTRALSEEQQKEREGQLILNQVTVQDSLVLLDERGEERRSLDFARWLGKRQASGRNLVLVIGGPYGFSEAVYRRADEMVSLSRMTFSHQMVRLILAEQLYRACTILKGEKYHHE